MCYIIKKCQSLHNVSLYLWPIFRHIHPSLFSIVETRYTKNHRAYLHPKLYFEWISHWVKIDILTMYTFSIEIHLLLLFFCLRIIDFERILSLNCSKWWRKSVYEFDIFASATAAAFIIMDIRQYCTTHISHERLLAFVEMAFQCTDAFKEFVDSICFVFICFPFHSIPKGKNNTRKAGKKRKKNILWDEMTK